ncbi:porin [Burkholderia sp. PU8-34]
MLVRRTVGGTFAHPVKVGAAALLLGIANMSFAQSSVTLYGVVDTGIEFINHVGATGQKVWRMPTLTGSFPSRWGLLGAEDIGGGNKVVFTLESGFAPSQGSLNQGGRLFGRQAFVGLSSNRWGTLTLGRQYTMSYWVFAGADVMGPSAYTVGVFDPYLANARVDNAVAYRVKFSGFDFGATYSFGRDSVAPPGGANCGGRAPTDSNACRDYSFMLRYDTDTWGVSTSYERIFGGPTATAGLSSSHLHDSRATLNAYGSIGNLTIGGGAVRRINDGNPVNRQSDLLYIGASYLITPAVRFVVQGGKLSYKSSDDTSEVVAARISYSISKLTSVYLMGGHVWNHGLAKVPVSGSSPIGADPAPGEGQSGFMVGIRHNF